MQNHIITHKLDDWANIPPEEVSKMHSTQKQFEKEFGDNSATINVTSEDNIKFVISLKTIIKKHLFNDSNDDMYTYNQFVCPSA